MSCVCHLKIGTQTYMRFLYLDTDNFELMSLVDVCVVVFFFFFQAEDGIRDGTVTGVQTCALPISLGDHAQTSFSVDGQPIADQQSKAFSTQVPLDAIQSMELITGAPPAEFGDKTSLIVNAVTKSGLGQKPNGSFVAEWGSFATYSEEATLALGGPKVGNFLAINAIRSGRFLDTPEFTPVHAIGNNGTIFDRFDYQPSSRDALHLNFF